MDDAERKALASLRFDWAPVPDDLWTPLPFHVEGLHTPVLREVEAGIEEARSSAAGSPIGLVLQGQRGSGKTHLLGSVRHQVHERGGYFFLVSLLDAGTFWESVRDAILDGLARPVPGSRQTQLGLLLRRLSAMVGAPRAARRAVMGETGLTRAALDEFIVGLGEFDRQTARTSQETARALALSASPDIRHRDVAENYFASGDEATPGERAAWGMRRAPRRAQQIVQDLSWLLALTGPAVIAVDQIDTLLAQYATGADPVQGKAVQLRPDDARTLRLMADGLMTLRQQTRRTLTLVACLQGTWTTIRRAAVDSVQDRFRESVQLHRIKDPALARALVEKRFRARFEEIGFAPPFDSWPVAPKAFESAVSFTPRELLIKIDQHVRGCLADDRVELLGRLGEPTGVQTPPRRPAPPPVSSAEITRFDGRFAELKVAADVVTPLERAAEDEEMPALLAAGLTAWVLERAGSDGLFSVDPPPSSSPALHARLRLVLNDETEDQAHWCFRAVSEQHHFNGAINRLKRAADAAAAEKTTGKRNLYLIRNSDWSQGPATQRALEKVTATLELDAEDLSILFALRTMLGEPTPELHGWLAERRPTRDLKFLEQALADVDSWLPGEASKESVPETTAADGPRIAIGHDDGNDLPVELQIEALRKHAVIFAGSGSGKTVLIRRIIEECALQGVSTIVLDPNNDLARLGDGWPQPPDAWRSGDRQKAAEYLRHTDVVVWTPRRTSGRAVSFQPLPDFASVLDDEDEFDEAVEAAVAALEPRAMVTGKANKAHLGRAVLRKAVEHYGRSGGTHLQGLIETLADLPDGLIKIADADKIAVGLAQTLTAEMVNDPLFGGDGTPLDPGVLLTPAEGKRARVSVISMVGLPSDAVRQTFVNQLQMALFSWIKRNPAGDRPLLGLLVMDEAQTLAPASPMTACTQSTLVLTAQARKYGLGLIFATQAPKALHNRIPGNSATQFYGLLNSPIQIEAVREMAKAKGGDVPDISRLSTGQFYLATEGTAPRKIRAPLSLSNHPRSPLTVDEVLERARGERSLADHLGDGRRDGDAEAARS
ncbi:helicase HerA domain-containing protein [Cryptosporangium sp. NPDC051539]|uniref:helicase HerA domain-containing protein n=1 Tax=Cryptosporangium sp. NPDC051539 TaxID=3363962 RepID=UPI00378CB71A